MKKLIENFAFIKKIDDELDEYLYDFLIDINQRIHKKLLEQYPHYREMIQERADLSTTLFNDKKDEYTKYINLGADIEIPVNISNFLLGIKLGMKMKG